jgi:hypothetical protein
MKKKLKTNKILLEEDLFIIYNKDIKDKYSNKYYNCVFKKNSIKNNNIFILFIQRKFDKRIISTYLNVEII